MKVGHAGTLDPFATGLLLLLVGRATRAQRFLMELPKTYRVVARLGWRSDTGDRDGHARADGPRAGADRAAHRRDHAGARPPTRPSRSTASAPTPGRVAARRWSRPRGRSPFTATSCSGARRIAPPSSSSVPRAHTCAASCRDLGDAYCEELERTAIGPFRLEDADPERIVPLAEALAFMPERAVDAEEARLRLPRAAAGRRGGRPSAADARWRADRDRRARSGRAAPVVVFAAEMKVTRLPDAPERAQRPPRGHRDLRRRAPRPPRGDPWRRHRAHLRAAPADRDPPGGDCPSCSTRSPCKRDLIAGLGVEELVVIPFDREFAAMEAEEFVAEVLVRAARRGAGLGGGELPLRQGRARHAGDAPRARRVRDPCGAARRGGGGDRLLEPHPRAGGGR